MEGFNSAGWSEGLQDSAVVGGGSELVPVQGFFREVTVFALIAELPLAVLKKGEFSRLHTHFTVTVQKLHTIEKCFYLNVIEPLHGQKEER